MRIEHAGDLRHRGTPIFRRKRCIYITIINSCPRTFDEDHRFSLGITMVYRIGKASQALNSFVGSICQPETPTPWIPDQGPVNVCFGFHIMCGYLLLEAYTESININADLSRTNESGC